MMRLWATTLLSLVLVASCDTDCREVEVSPIALTCVRGFSGELHLDSAATYRTFLRDRCFAAERVDEVDRAVAAVNFDRDAVFVASGLRLSDGRCVAARQAEAVAVCGDGLRIAFVDTLGDPATCDGNWTTAFTLARGDLRAALQPSP